jgi:DNA-binding GntR family transcriptional regulator
LSRLAAERRSADDVDRATSALEDLAQVVEHQERPEFWVAHATFHLALLAPALTGWSRRLLDQLWQGSERYVRLFAGRFGSVAAAMQDHALLLDAFAAGDPSEMETRLEAHLTHTETAVREGYRRLLEQRERASEAAAESDGAPDA